MEQPGNIISEMTTERNKMMVFIENHPYILVGLIVILIIVILFMFFKSPSGKKKTKKRNLDNKSDEEEIDKLIVEINEKQSKCD